MGKSTVAEAFARSEYESYILIDFSNTSSEIKELFDDISDLREFFLKLQLHCNVTLRERRSLIIFDEVQLFPRARQAIKHLVADGRYDYLETGSLVSLHQNVKDILIPSEETRISMHPMDYEEFRWALGNSATFDLLRNWAGHPKALGEKLNRRLLRDFRVYMLTGGMPQAVAEYLEQNDFSRVDRVKREILQLYEEDFHKFDPSGKASVMFDQIPAQLTGNASRYRISSAIPHADYSKVANRVSMLRESMAANLCYRVSDPNAGLSLTLDLARFKLFTADTGLFVTLAFKDKRFAENIIYRKLMGDRLRVNLGYVYENMVAQMLTACGRQLYYHTFPTPDRKHNYEIDFLLSAGDGICPIEVKSSGYKTHASLDSFCAKYRQRIKSRYLVYTKDYAKEQDLVCLPVYLVPLLCEKLSGAL